MNYWPATCTNLLECFTPLVDYVRGLVEPGQAYRTGLLRSTRMDGRGIDQHIRIHRSAQLHRHVVELQPHRRPWLATQIWEYYDYTRDEEWLRNIGYDIIKSSADFCSDLLYKVNGTYTSAPSYSPEHGSSTSAPPMPMR